MLEISMTLNGKPISSASFKDEIERAFFESASEQVSSALRGIRCPVHDQPVKVDAEGTSLHDLSWHLRGCCEALLKDAAAAIGARPTGREDQVSEAQKG